MVRTDDLAAHPLTALRQAFPDSDWERIDEIVLGGVNQAGEDNRNVARMASLLSGMPASVPAVTVNRLCASGMEAVSVAARAITAGEISLAIAGGVESMSRSPFVMPKATSPFARTAEIYDTTLGWRFINPVMEKMYRTDSMAQTAENVAAEYGVDRASQDLFALRSHQKAAAAQRAGIFAEEIVPVKAVREDEHIRPTQRSKPWRNWRRRFAREERSRRETPPALMTERAPCSWRPKQPRRSLG